MALGMSRDEYWNGDVCAVDDYIRAFQIKKQQENERLWLQGMYFYEALAVVMKNLFSKKGSKPAKYPEKPYDIYKRELTEREKELEVQRERQRAHDYLDSVVQAFKKRKEGREVNKP